MKDNGWDEVINSLQNDPQLQQSLTYFSEQLEAIVDQAVAICEIPAPSYQEYERGQYVSGRMKEIGLVDVYIDDKNNAIGRYKGHEGTARLAVSAHMDTVFPADVDTHVKRENNRLYAPGIGDNSVSVSALLAIAASWKAADYVPPFDVIFVGNSCEEGLGDLNGIKGFLDGYAQRDDVELGAMVALDGKMGAITNAGIGSRRLKVDITARGGHSWGDFGSPSAIHALGAAINSIARMDVPEKPKTSFNVGVIAGGTSVNTIAEHASMLIDMRSVALEPLKEVETEVRQFIAQACKDFGAEYTIEVVGDRPVGKIPEDHPLVQIARAAGRRFDLQMPTRASSTDANVPLSRNIPAMTVGIYRGEGSHRRSEWIEPSSLKDGLPLGLLIVRGVVDWLSRT